MQHGYAVEARGLIKTYPAKGGGGTATPDTPASGKRAKPRIRALDGLDLCVPRGAIFTLVGPNGAGKSTTVKILTSLARPDEGSAAVAGLHLLAHPPGVRRALGVVRHRARAPPAAPRP